MPGSDYRLWRTAIHEAGHVAVAEAQGESWFSATVRPDGTGEMLPTCDAVPLLDPAAVARGSLSTCPAAKAFAQRTAIRFFAGRAAELVIDGEQPHAERFFGYADFDDATAFLRAADHEAAIEFCRLAAWEICFRRRERIEELAEALIRQGTIYAADWPPTL